MSKLVRNCNQSLWMNCILVIMKQLIAFCFVIHCLQASALQAYQATLWRGQVSSKASANTPLTYVQVYPRLYDPATYQRSVVFAGFSMAVIRNISFGVSLASTSAGGDTLSFSIYEDLTVVYISFQVLLVDLSCPWLWTQESSHVMTVINSAGTTLVQNYTLMLSRPIVVAETQIWIFIKDYTAHGPPPSFGPQIYLQTNTYTSSSINIGISRVLNGKRVYNMSCQVLLVNTATTSANTSMSFNTYAFYTQISGGFNNIVAGYAVNFGIAAEYASSVSAFDGRCFVGITQLYIDYFTIQAVFWADLTQNPVGKNYYLSKGGGSVGSRLRYTFVCLRQIVVLSCNASLGYDNCTACDASGCQQCQTNFSILTVNGTDLCVSADCISLGFYDCAQCTFTECLACNPGFITYLSAGNPVCATALCLSQFNLTNCQLCTNGDCLVCSPDFYLKNINGSVLCATYQCSNLFNLSYCIECIEGQCLQCYPNFYPLSLNGSQPCATSLAFCPNLNFSNCLECIADRCLSCQSGFYLKTLNSSTYCATTLCDTRLHHQHCGQCLYQECLTCQTGFYFRNVSGQNICVTQQCGTKFNFRNCYECTFQGCLQCQMNFYIKTVNGFPVCATNQCSILFGLDNCQECHALGCLQCMADFHPVTVATAQFCATNQCLTYFGLDNCSECTISGCIKCDTNFVLTLVNSEPLCVTERCYLFYGMVGCNSCTASKCFGCGKGYYFEGGKCLCLEGTMINNICTTIDGCVDPVIGLSGVLTCRACNQTYFRLVDGKCDCINGQLVNGICNTVPGCMVPAYHSTGIVCKYCNITAQYQGTPTTDGQCQCKQYHQINQSTLTCVQICGNGVLLLSYSTSLCDDGNAVDFDGCSSSCRVEPYYRCANTYGGTSKCRYVGVPINMTFTYAEREEEDVNSAVMVFELTPDLFFLRLMDFNARTELVCGVDTVTMRRASYSKGVLTILADFTQDIESVPCSVNVTYDSELTSTDNSYLLFNVTSRNGQLTYIKAEAATLKSQVSFIFRVLSWIVLAVAVLGIRHKMVGVELIFMSQVAYFSHGLSDSPSYLGGAVKKMGWVSGYRELYYVLEYTGGYREIYEFCWQFMENNIVWLAVVGTALLVMLAVKIYELVKATKQEEAEPKVKRNKKQKTPIKQVTITDYLYSCVIFPLVTSNLVVVVLTTYFDMFRSARSYTFGHQLNSIAEMLSWAVAGCVVGVEVLGLYSNRIGGVHEMKKGYSFMFMTQLLLFSILVVLFTFLKLAYLVWAILTLFLLYFIVLLTYQPYKSILSAISVLALQLTMIYSLGLSIMHNHYHPKIETQALLLFLLQAMISLSIVLAVSRLCVYYWELVQLNCRESNRNKKQNCQLNKLKKKDKKHAEMDNQVQLSLFNSLNPYKSIEHQPKIMTKTAQRRGQNRSHAPGKPQVERQDKKILRKDGVRRDEKVQYHEEVKYDEEVQNDEDKEVLEIKKRLRKNLVEYKKRAKQEETIL